MKKMLKLFTAFTMLFLMLSIAGCSLATEDELLARVGRSGGSGGSALWSRFEGADMQVWVVEGTTTTTADVAERPDCIDITIKTAGWWGMCFCNDKAVSASQNPVTFDMSRVHTITFDAKASQTASMWVSQIPSNTANQRKIDLTTDFASKTFTLQNPGNRDYGVLAMGGGDLDTTTTTGVVISIKNIKFLDANGTEIVPTRNE